MKRKSNELKSAKLSITSVFGIIHLHVGDEISIELSIKQAAELENLLYSSIKYAIDYEEENEEK